MNQSLATLLEHAERQRDVALAQQRRADAQLDAAVRQHEQLSTYSRDHQSRWHTAMRQSVTMPLVQCNLAFTDRLHQAVSIQSEQVDRARQALMRRKTETLEAERKVASINKLIERRRQTLQQHQARQEQRQIDERASRMAWNRLHEAAGHGG
ncbi:MAG: flagellar protein FliJ [Pseudomonadota bacterium]|nr:flagellar protein FliJ [Pseudomonadota bacterium]